MTVRLHLCVLAVAAMLAVPACHAEPSMVATADGNLSVQANDLGLVQANGLPAISMLQLKSELDRANTAITTLQNITANVMQTYEIVALVDAAVAGALNDVSRMINASVAPLATRVATNEAALASLPQTQTAVSRLAQDVNVLLEHTNNVTTCAASGNVHAGNGTCVNPVPQCPRPTTPTNGIMTLSNDYIIPGVTATYSCPQPRNFVAGPALRTCNLTTRQFDGADPQCLVCQVASCDLCVGTVNRCARCAAGFDLVPDASRCVVRADTVLIFGGNRDGSRHNYREVQALLPNAPRWTMRSPYPPISGSQGSGGIMGNVVYLVGGGGHGSMAGYYKLDRNANRWSTFSGTNGFNQRSIFYATVQGVGRTQDGLYMFGTGGSNVASVYQPSVNANAWTRLTSLPRAVGRTNGATAVVGDGIYCLGGILLNRQKTNMVNVFNTTTRRWQTSTPMTSVRAYHGASSWNGRVYVFGGQVTNVVVNTVEEFDPMTNRWTTKAPMREGWQDMSTGPLPAYIGGSILLPFGRKRQGQGMQNSQIYFATNNTWGIGPVPPLTVGRYTVVIGSLS